MWNPRVGGEKILEPSMGVGNFGSPPRGRGKVSLRSAARGQPRITPAWAGKSPDPLAALLKLRDHPRVGGEKIYVDEVLPGDTGSPPRRRGKADVLFSQFFARRITPALAGKRCTANGCRLK